MSELITLYNALSSVGFPVLLFVALVGSRLKIWYWGWALEEEKKDRIEQKIEYEKRLAEQKQDYEHRISRLESSVDKWQHIGLTATGTSETATQILKSKAA